MLENITSISAANQRLSVVTEDAGGLELTPLPLDGTIRLGEVLHGSNTVLCVEPLDARTEGGVRLAQVHEVADTFSRSATHTRPPAPPPKPSAQDREEAMNLFSMCFDFIDKCCLVPAGWMDALTAYAMGDSDVRPGPANNLPLCAVGGGLRATAHETDYRLISEQAWAIIVAMFPRSGPQLLCTAPFPGTTGSAPHGPVVQINTPPDAAAGPSSTHSSPARTRPIRPATPTDGAMPMEVDNDDEDGNDSGTEDQIPVRLCELSERFLFNPKYPDTPLMSVKGCM